MDDTFESLHIFLSLTAGNLTYQGMFGKSGQWPWERNLSQPQGSLQMENQRDSLEDTRPSERGLGLKSSGKNSSKRKNRHDDLDLGAQVRTLERTGILDRTSQPLVSDSSVSTHLGPIENEHGPLGSSTGHRKRGESQSLYSAPYVPEVTGHH